MSTHSLLKSTAILSVSALTVAVTTPLVNADGTSSQATTSYTTSTGVTFTPATDPTGPVNPDSPDPTHPVNPQKPDGTKPNSGTSGPLSIDYVSDFDFGTQKISSADQTYFATAQSYSGNQSDTSVYAQISDNRGTGAGWTLSVTQDGQLTAGNNELKGAQITINDLSANTVSGSEAENAIAGGNINLTPGDGAFTVMSAKQGAGQGTWVVRMGDTSKLVDENGTGEKGSVRKTDHSVSLSVPGAANKIANMQYSSTLTWTLSDTPAND